jgi:hypothetical protein
MTEVSVLVGAVLVMGLCVLGVGALLDRYGKKAVASRQQIGWVKGKGSRW